MVRTCLCGCGHEVVDKDSAGRRRYFRQGHNSVGEYNYQWKGGRYISQDGYVCMQAKGHPRGLTNQGYVFEHILVMEKHLGRQLRLDEVVHHKNHNKQDNRIENLELMSRANHMRLHFKVPEEVIAKRRCSVCGSADTWVRKSSGRPVWYYSNRDKTKFLCQKCYDVEKK